MTDKKITNEEAVAKIKALINRYFENVGREVYNDTETARIELIDDIDDVLDDTDISTKHLIMEQFELDKLVREER